MEQAKIYNSIQKLTYLSILCFLLTIQASAQSDWRSWDGLRVKAPLTKKLDATLGHLRTYSMTNGFSNSFNQTKIDLTYDINKKWDVEGGVLFMTTPNSNTKTSRFYVEVIHKSKLGKKIAWYNQIHAEINSASETRFRERIVLSTRLGLRKRLDFLNLSPSIGYSLYYNIGGSLVQYYDQNLQPVALQSPDGFHRGRFILNLNSKINKHVSVSLYYLSQHEFNFITGPYHEMNYFDPIKSKIRKGFSDYKAIGLTLTITIGKDGNKPLLAND